MQQSSAQTFTQYGWFACCWVLVAAFQYGWNISVLNQIQAVITCSTSQQMGSSNLLPTCIPGLSKTVFSLVTAVFSAGGLGGSALASVTLGRLGRKQTIVISALLTGMGTSLMAASSTVSALLLGRLLVGFGAGLGISGGPVFIAEIAPAGIKGLIGVLTQMGIVVGIMLTQAAGLRLATPHQWRFVLLISSVISFVHLLFAPIMVESPAFVRDLPQRDAIKSKLWGGARAFASDGSEALLNGADDVDGRPINARQLPHEPSNMSISLLFKTRDLRGALFIVGTAMICQQISGINAVLYYSNDILSKTMPDFGPYMSLGITVINVIMTFPPLFLIERLGKKTLMRISVTGLIASLICLGLALDTNLVVLASISVLTFVMSFAIGLGPVPFVIIPDVSPQYAVSALSSVALSLNWIANFLVGLCFLPLRQFLSGGDTTKEGRVFYVFAGLLACIYSMFSRSYNP